MHNESITDHLSEESELRVRESVDDGVFIENLKYQIVSSQEEMMSHFKIAEKNKLKMLTMMSGCMRSSRVTTVH